MSLSSFGAIAGGINQGMDMNRRDEQLKEQLEASRQNRQAMMDQNEYLKEQRDRNRKQQARDDAFGDEVAGITKVGDIKGAKAAEEGPAPIYQTEIGRARDTGAAYLRKRDTESADKYFRWADEAASKRAAESWVAKLSTLPRDASLRQIAEVAATGVDADESPIGVDPKSITDLDGGGIGVTLYNKTTGAKQNTEFKSVADLKNALSWHYAPDYMRELEKKRVDAANKTHEIQPGGKVVRGDGVVVATNDNEPAAVQAARIREAGRAAAGSGTGSGAGGKAPKTPQSVAIDFFATAAEKAETKLTPTQIAYGQRVAEQISTQRGDNGQPIPPAIAAEVAMEVALDPAKIQPQVNVRTGKIEGVFSRRDLGDVVVQPWSPALQKSFTPEQLTKAAEELVKAQPDDVRAEFVKAAHDPEARKAFVEKVVKKITETVPPDQVQAYTQSTLSSLTEKLDIVSRNTKPPKSESSGSRLGSFVGGIWGRQSAGNQPTDATSAAGKFQARQEEARRAAQQRAEQKSEAERSAAAELATQFEKDKGLLPPEDFARKYDAVRFKLTPAQAQELRKIEQGI